jgi:hypothetical protein
LKRHFTSRRADHQKIDGLLRKDEIKKLKKNLDTQQQMFNKQRTQHHSIVKASFVVSETIAKHSKHLMKENLSKNVRWMLQEYVLKRKKNICLSRRTVVRRIEMMADDIK